MEEIIITPEDAEQRLDRFLKKRFSFVPYGLWARLARTGKLRLNKRKVPLGTALAEGDVLMIRGVDLREKPVDAKRPKKSLLSSKEAQTFHEWVIHEDDNIIAINKPANVATQGGTRVQTHVDAYLQHLNHEKGTQLKLVHRLDRDTSGVLLIAKHAKAARLLTQAFKEGTIQKTYWALTLGVPELLEGEVKAPLMKKNIGGQELMVVDPKGDRAVTHYNVVEFAGSRVSFMALTPTTGRTHQLRVHMQYLGTPILGDPKYKGEREPIDNVAAKLHLHARSIEVPNLFGKGVLRVVAPPNAVFLKTCDQLGFEDALKH